MAATISIDWDTLETAVERNSPNTESYLELATGQVITLVGGESDVQGQDASRVKTNPSDFVRVEPASSREQYRWMERFVSSVSDEALRRRLVISIDGKGAFRRFKDVLLAYPAERERWFSYRSNLLHWHIQNWMENHELESNTAPPWGELDKPQELEKATGADATVGTAPGESLRRQARELIDGITPMELPSAIAFLEFLKEKGSKSLQNDASEEQEGLKSLPSIVG